MLKIVKNKKVVILICGIIILISATFVYGKDNINILQSLNGSITADDFVSESNVQSKTKPNEIDNSLEKVINKSKNSDKKLEDIENISYEFAMFLEQYKPKKAELELLTDLIVNKNANIQDTIDIYIFWLDTDEPVETIERMYNISKEMDKTNNKYWIENTFNAINQTQLDIFDSSKAEEYLKKGLTLEDLRLANTLSRKSKYTIIELLDARVNGTGWGELMADTYEKCKNPDVKIQKSIASKYVKADDARVIQQAVFLSRKSDKDVNKVLLQYDTKEKIGQLSDEVLSKEKEKVTKKLEAKGIKKDKSKANVNNIDKKGTSEDLKSNIIKRILDNNVPQAKIDELIQKGYTYTDILNASKLVKKDGRSIEDALEYIISITRNGEVQK